MDAKQIRAQIKQIEAKAESELKALKARLMLTDSGFKVGDTLKSVLSENETFTVSGSNDQGLVGSKTIAKESIRPEEFKHWRLNTK